MPNGNAPDRNCTTSPYKSNANQNKCLFLWITKIYLGQDLENRNITIDVTHFVETNEMGSMTLRNCWWEKEV